MIIGMPAAQMMGGGPAPLPGREAVFIYYQSQGTENSNIIGYYLDNFSRVDGLVNSFGSMAYSQPKRLIAKADAPVLVIDAVTLGTISTPGIPSFHRRLAFSPDGAVLVGVIFGAVVVVSTTTWAVTQTLTYSGSTSAIQDIKFSPNGSTLAIASDSSPYLTLYDTVTWLGSTPSVVPTSAFGCAFSPNGQYLAVGAFSGMMFYQGPSWSRMTDLPSNFGNVEAVAFSPDSASIYVSNRTSPYLRKYTFPGCVLTNTASQADATFARDLSVSADGSRVCGSEKIIFNSDLTPAFEATSTANTNISSIIARIG